MSFAIDGVNRWWKYIKLIRVKMKGLVYKLRCGFVLQ